MPTRSLRLAVLAAVLSITAHTAIAKGPCRATIGETASQVIQRCGKPDGVAATRSIVGWHIEEWRYGEVCVGLIDGRVNYVLK